MIKSPALVLALVGMATLGGCANVVSGTVAAVRANSEQAELDANQKPELTQLEIRQMQTRVFATEDVRKIQQVALDVLQDEGFVVSNANGELGLLAASKSLFGKEVDDVGTAFVKGFFGFFDVSTEEWSSVEATLTVRPFGEQSRVRYSARLSATSSNGQVSYEAIHEPEFYQDFFTKLEKGLFIEGQQL